MRPMRSRRSITIVIEPPRLNAEPSSDEVFEEEVDAAFGDLIKWVKSKLSPPPPQPLKKQVLTGGLTSLSPLLPLLVLRRLLLAPPNLEPRRSRNSTTPKKTLGFAKPCSQIIRKTQIICLNTLLP